MGSLSHIFFFSLGSGMSLVDPTRMTWKFITSGILLEPRRMNQIWSENPAPLDRNQQYGGPGPDKQEPWVDVGSGQVFCAQAVCGSRPGVMSRRLYLCKGLCSLSGQATAGCTVVLRASGESQLCLLIPSPPPASHRLSF